MVIKVTDETFDEIVLKSDKPVVVDFGATWCGPCRSIEPFLEQISDEYADKAKVVKVDIEECVGVSQRYRIMSVPTVLFIKNGEVVSKNVGGAPKKVFEDKLIAIL